MIVLIPPRPFSSLLDMTMTGEETQRLLPRCYQDRTNHLISAHFQVAREPIVGCHGRHGSRSLYSVSILWPWVWAPLGAFRHATISLFRGERRIDKSHREILRNRSSIRACLFLPIRIIVAGFPQKGKGAEAIHELEFLGASHCLPRFALAFEVLRELKAGHCGPFIFVEFGDVFQRAHRVKHLAGIEPATLRERCQPFRAGHLAAISIRANYKWLIGRRQKAMDD